MRAIVFSFVVLALSACASTTVKPYAGAAPKTEIIYVIATGWHTEVALPADRITGGLRIFKQDFGGARWLAFGWGERSFFMAAHPGIGEALRAVFPATSVLLVTGLAQPPQPSADVVPLRVSAGGLAQLSRYIWSYVSIPPNGGAPQPLAPGPVPGSAFYASAGTYDLFHTCNTWTAEALHVAGVDISAGGVVFASQLMDRVRQSKAAAHS